MAGKSKRRKHTAADKPKRVRSYLKFRTRWRHVLLIDQRIRSGQAPNCRQLAGELEVSRRTVLRDIEFLRDDLAAPLEYDPRKRGYVYTEPNWDMPSVRITEGELFALMVANEALEAYSATPWARKVEQVFERMVGSLPDRVEIAPRELLGRVRFDPGGVSEYDPAVLETLVAATKENRTLQMTYRPLGASDSRQYRIDPYMLRLARGAWYLIGRDRRSGHVPTFNVSRIEHVEPTEATFDYEASGFDAGKYFPGTFGVYESKEHQRCIVEFSGFAALLVRERRWCDSQKLTDLPGGRLRFEAEVAHLDDIWPWVMSWGAEAKVRAPKKLARLVAEQAAGTARLYDKISRKKEMR